VTGDTKNRRISVFIPDRHATVGTGGYYMMTIRAELGIIVLAVRKPHLHELGTLPQNRR
jgi:hypothetical protein